jgi:SAM-dependent methyltransferase
MPTFHDARAAYERGANIMRIFREQDGTETNSTEAVLVSYDLQSGSYRRALDLPAHREKLEAYTSAMVSVLDTLAFGSLLDAGTGEATTFCPILSKLKQKPLVSAGFDLSWSRVAHAREHARSLLGDVPRFFTGDLFSIPIVEDAFDCVFTSHALEPNHGRETAALAELARVTRRYVVLFEPSYELGGEATHRRIEEHGYVRGLAEAARAAGLRVIRHELMTASMNPSNESAVLVLEKQSTGAPSPTAWLACPCCQAPLVEVKSALFCESDGLVFPVLDGIPALLPSNGVLASQFAGLR